MSLVARLILLWSLLTAALVGLFGFLTYRSNRDHLLQTWRDTLEHEALTVQVKVQSSVADAARDALYLTQTPTVREFIRQRGHPDEPAWRRLVEEDFHAVLAGKPSYFQVRLIGASAEGPEIIRLDRTPGGIEIIPPEKLQNKGDRDYFQETMRLAPGAVYLSDINLNRDFGKVTVPHTPTLRAAMKLQTDGGETFGILVINVDVGDLLRELSEQKAPGVRLYLANAVGDHLIHPDPTRRFRSDLHPTGITPEGSRANEGASADELLWNETLFRPFEKGGSNLHLRVAAPKTTLLGGLREARNQAITGTLLAACAAALVIALAARPFARRLHQVTEAIARYEAGQDVETLPPAGRDEIGLLAGKFREMAANVRDDVTKLDAARHEAEEATRAKDDFLAVMSHEIRTPMNAVIGLLRVLERNRPAPHQEPVLNSLRIAARQLMILLNEALDYSKIKAGRIEFESSEFSLAELLSDVVTTHRPLASQKGLELHFNPADDLPAWVRGDSIRLAQILNNLLGNAIKFTDQGFVQLEARREDAKVRFIVSDSGIGIAEENVGRIFSPFDQAHGDIGRRFGGTGLGLSIARSLVDLQGGRLEVESRPGAGSRFTVTLPLPAAQPAPLARGAEEAVPDLSSKRLLYVEDVASNREVLAATLAETRAALDFAQTGAEAIEKIGETSYDVVLLDLQLPDTNGMEVARHALFLRPKLRILAVTAQVSAETRDACQACGMCGLVGKPFAPEALFRELVRCLPDGDLEPGYNLDRLRETFGNETGRLVRIVGTLAEEFAQHEKDLARALAGDDLEALRRLRHKMHTALAQLGAAPLRAAFDALIAAPDDPAARTRVTRHLREAREYLQRETALIS